MKQIHIVGGGLAGLSLGIWLRGRDVPVRLTEAAHYPRHRVCGEFISGIRREQLEELGIVDLFEGAELCTTTAWYDRKGKFLQKQMPEPAIGISRHLLDYRLANRFVELGGHLETGTRSRIDRSVATEGTVIATGRARQTEGEWLGLKCHLSGMTMENDLEMHLTEGGYLGLSLIEKQQVNACGLFRLRRDLNVSRETALEGYLEHCGFHRLLRRFQKADRDDESCVAVNAFEFGIQPESERPADLCIGDRFSVIGPFTGHGMTLAFESALISGEWIRKFAAGAVDWGTACEGATRDMRRRFRRRLLMSSALHPFLTSRNGRKIFSSLGRAGLIPFGFVLQLVR